MPRRPVQDLPRHRSLFRMIFAPTIWAVHFVLAYATTAIWCEKVGGDTAGLTWIVSGYTLVAEAAIAWFAVAMWRQWDYMDDFDYVHAGATDEDRREFLGHAGFMLACLSFVAVIFSTLPVWLIGKLHMSRAALAAALALLALAWAAPLDRLAGPFPAHMLRHMALVAMVPPLLLRGWPALGVLGRLPVALAAALEFAVVWGWHAPALHEAAYFSPVIFAAEQASFLLAGLVVWAAALSGPRLVGAGGMLLTSMHMTLLGALLVLAPRALYADCDLVQQQLGGMLMLAIGTPVYLAAGLRLTARALTDEAPA